MNRTESFNSAVITSKQLTMAWVEKLLLGANRYKTIESLTGVPWFMVGAIHGLECSFSFNGCFHNGDPLDVPTKKYPKNRGPFKDWEASAIDALNLVGYVNQAAWTLEKILFRTEMYNGLGYARRGMFSPYLWSGTQLYVKGKFRFDGVFDENLVSSQIGLVATLKELSLRGLVNIS